MLRIRVDSADGHSRVYEIDSATCKVGRAPHNTIIIDTPYASAEHCAIVWAGGQWMLTDSSRNGTFVDGRRVNVSARLSTNCTIQIGDTSLTLGDGGEDLAPAPAPTQRGWSMSQLAAMAGLVACVAATATALALRDQTGDSTTGSALPSDTTPAEEEADLVTGDVVSPPPEWIDHIVIPGQSIDAIASRYGIAVEDIARWNHLNPDRPQVDEGQTLSVRPIKRPMQHRLIHYLADRGETWKAIAERFGVELEHLRAANPNRGESPGTQEPVRVYVDLQPYAFRPRDGDIPHYEPPNTGVSVGAPNKGKLEGGVLLPNNQLYKRRARGNMYGSTHAVRHLAAALSWFRHDIDYQGTIVVGDLSRSHGGKFDPHNSHQSGRDVDIWLPAVRGVYKTAHLGAGDRKRQRRPEPEEVDWFALWGLIRALALTGETQYIFLDETLHGHVREAARIMSPDPSDRMGIVEGRSRILRHSAAHTHHIHVRFNCGPLDRDCRHLDRP